MPIAKENPLRPTEAGLIALLPSKDRETYREYNLRTTIQRVRDGSLKPGVHSCLIVQNGRIVQVGAFIEKDGSCSVQPWDFSTDVSL